MKSVVIAVSAFVALLGVETSVAQAQDEESGQNDISEETAADAPIPEIIVTGEKLGRDVMQTMSSVNVQTAEEIERSSDQTIRDVFLRASNISGSKNMTFSIRGVSSSGSGFASTPLASVFVDGAQTSFNQIGNDVGNLFDVEQVEILRGPQSTSQGGASMAGAVYLGTKAPTFERETIIRTGIAEYATYDLAIAHGGPITDRLAYRVVLDYEESDGVISNPVRGADDDDFIDNLLGRVKLLYESPDENFRALLTYSYLDGGNGFNNEPWEPPSADQENRNPFRNDVDIEQSMASLELTFDFSDALSLTSVTSYNDYDSVFTENRVIGTAPVDREDLVVGTVLDEIHGQEIRLNFDSAGVSGVAGVFYNYKNRGRDQFGSDNHVTVNQNISSDQLYESYSVFAEADIGLGEQWTLTLGGRYEDVDSTFTEDVAGVRDEYNDSAFVAKAGLRYTFNPDHVLGFTFSQGYRPGSVTFTGFTPYDPEFLDNYELTYRGRFMGGMASLNTNIYYYELTDLQTTVFMQVPVFVFDTLNAGKATSVGGEIELTFAPTDQLSIFAGIGVTNGEYDDFVSGIGDFSGNELPDAPPLNVSAGIFQDWGKYSVGVNADYLDEFYTDAANSEDQKADSRTIVNVTAAYRPRENVVVTAYVNNLFDERYQDGFGFSRALVPGGPPAQAVFPQGDPRQVGVRAEVRF